MKTFMDVIISVAKEESIYFKKWRKYAKIIKERAASLLPSPRVLIFGSIIEGKAIPGKSDLDILIISDNIPKLASEQTKLSLKLKSGFEGAPIEIHFTTPKIFEKWYKKFLKKWLEIR